MKKGKKTKEPKTKEEVMALIKAINNSNSGMIKNKSKKGVKK